MISTQRCLLRTYAEEDIEPIIAFYQKNEQFLKPWEPQRTQSIFTKSYWQQAIKKNILDYDEKKALPLLIVNKKTQALMGFIHFNNFEYEPFLNCRVGYKLGEEYQGQAYMYESLQAAMAYIFNETKIRRIEANFIPNNKRSERLLKKLGFEVHGIAPAYLQINGQWQDHCLSSLLKDVFNKKN
ncbi:MAG TPA: GNAT family N-acetyltransferase [Oligoflexia bacterium]|nr:GNAT family N-acetyltransferase [Oligoflexia bacterium]HMR24226.1 GNAT family N-acetyltransferase [Oligoflexia bacterium]